MVLSVQFGLQVLDEVEKRRMQNSLRAEEFLQAVYGRPMPSPGQSVTIRAMVMITVVSYIVTSNMNRLSVNYQFIIAAKHASNIKYINIQ